MSKPRFAILGAGHGGQAMAGYLALLGYEVSLFTRSLETMMGIEKHGGIKLGGSLTGLGRLSRVTADYGTVLDNTDVVMVVVPASSHRDVALSISQYVHENQVVVLNPGRTGGALEFDALLRRNGVKGVTVAETQTFLFASRVIEQGQVNIYSIKNEVGFAALPASRTGEILGFLGDAFPQFKESPSVLHTGFDNIGGIFHPAPTLLNAGWIQATDGAFTYYHQGITPAVANVLEALDRERLQVAKVFDIQAQSAHDWLVCAYGAQGNTLYEAIQNTLGYSDIKAPDTLDHRYIYEDVATSLVPLSALARVANVAVPATDLIIELAYLMTGTDYRLSGRSLKTMGLEYRGVDEILEWVKFGKGVG